MLTAMLSLMLYVGAPLAWLRVDFIGSVSYELQGANFAADGMGIELGTAAMDASYLSTASLVMTMGCLGWVIFAALFSDKMEKVNAVMSGGNEKLVPILGTGALIGVYASLTMDRLYPFKNQGFAVLAAAALMFLIQSYNKKANKAVAQGVGADHLYDLWHGLRHRLGAVHRILIETPPAALAPR